MEASTAIVVNSGSLATQGIKVSQPAFYATPTQSVLARYRPTSMEGIEPLPAPAEERQHSLPASDSGRKESSEQSPTLKWLIDETGDLEQFSAYEELWLSSVFPSAVMTQQKLETPSNNDVMEKMVGDAQGDLVANIRWRGRKEQQSRVVGDLYAGVQSYPQARISRPNSDYPGPSAKRLRMTPAEVNHYDKPVQLPLTQPAEVIAQKERYRQQETEHHARRFSGDKGGPVPPKPGM